MGRPIGNRYARHGRQSDTLPELSRSERNRKVLRGDRLTDQERDLLWKVVNRCLVDEEPGTYPNGGRQKVAGLVAEEIQRRYKGSSMGCTYQTIAAAIRGRNLHPIRAEAIRAILPQLAEQYCIEELAIKKMEPPQLESLGVLGQIASMWETLPAWRRKAIAAASGLDNED